MSATDFLDKNLTNLIRVYHKDAINDARGLATHVLTPVKSELDGPMNRFSADLFAVACLYAVTEESSVTLREILNLVHTRWPVETEMLRSLTATNHKISKGSAGDGLLKRFRNEAQNMSVGVAHRTVSRSYAQWCKAFNLPAPTKSTHKVSRAGEKRTVNNGIENFDFIRIGTQFELSDAIRFATQTLKTVKKNTDSFAFEFAHELLVAVTITVAHTERTANFSELMKFISDPAWDHVKQIPLHIGNCPDLTRQTRTKEWVTAWCNKVSEHSFGTAESLFNRSHALWQQALDIVEGKSIVSEQTVIPLEQKHEVQVFDMQNVQRALTMVCELRDEKKGTGERMLKSALINNGYRAVPDAKQAGHILEKAKLDFENLIEPISHLQSNLILAAAMKPEDFRVTPILLLGDPGIGKTFLAMALAEGLGGSTEKLSAGGAQGGFQLTGTHNTFLSARYGQVFKSLAEGKTSSPVFVIDEVDKIGIDERYPVLPVLLDLFEPNTACQFKDEFFEMSFDASRIIYILTANSLESVPEPLLSRIEVFDVPRPEAEQRLRIIQSEAKQLRAATNQKIYLDKSSCQQLAEREDIDLRKTTRIVRDAFAKAIFSGDRTAKLIISNLESRRGRSAPYMRSEIGFR